MNPNPICYLSAKDSCEADKPTENEVKCDELSSVFRELAKFMVFMWNDSSFTCVRTEYSVYIDASKFEL